MTFDLEWAKNPTSGGITGRYEANQIWVSPDGETELGTLVHLEGPGFYHINNACWWWLLDTMEAHGMLSGSEGRRGWGPGIDYEKLTNNNGAWVRPKETSQALAAYRRSAGSIELRSDVEDPDVCRTIWDGWIAWLETAKDHGGFIVR
jgi:hypothetical protein